MSDDHGLLMVLIWCFEVSVKVKQALFNFYQQQLYIELRTYMLVVPLQHHISPPKTHEQN
jgi:hypothetical protein